MNDLIQKVQDMASDRAQPEEREPGPGDAGPTVGGSTLVQFPLSEDEVGTWWKRIEAATGRAKAQFDTWDILLKEYLPTVSKSGDAETVKVAKHFRNVHTKIGQLFYRKPDLVLTPDDPGPASNSLLMPPPQPGMPPVPITQEQIVAAKQAVLNKVLGRDGIKVERLMDELLFDVLAWSGIGVCKVGYRAVMKSIPQPMATLPSPQPGAILGLGAMSQLTQMQSVPVFEEWYARRVSPKKYFVDTALKSTRVDEDAVMVGMHFYMAPDKAKVAFNLTDDDVQAKATDTYTFKHKGDTDQSDLVHGVEVWLKASYFTDEVHPDVIYQLVLIEGMKKPAVYRMSPDQEFDPQTGRLTNDSMLGFPLCVLTIRDLAESCYPPSDSAITNNEIKQLNTWRRQSVKIRDAAIGKYLYDEEAFTDTEQLKNGEVGEYIPVSQGALQAGSDKILSTTAQVHGTADDYRAQQIMSQDIDEALGISAVQAGTTEATVRSATEISTVSSAGAGRTNKELTRVVDFYLDLVRKLDQLLQRYATMTRYVQILGQNEAQVLVPWNKSLIQGKYLYEIAPDSQSRPDSESDFADGLKFYNLAAQDPLLNRPYILKRLARARGWDPAKAVLPPPPPPPPKVEPPKITVSLKGDDLILDPLTNLPVNPVAMVLVEMADPALKPQLPPGVAGSLPPHVAGGGPVNQHEATMSGRLPNAPGATPVR